MKDWQRVVKHGAMVLAGVLAASIIGGFVNIVLSLVEGDSVSAEMHTHTIEHTESIESLDMDISAAELVIQTGDAFLVESNLKKLSIKTQNNTLILSETSKYNSCGGVSFDGGKNTPKLFVTIPAEQHFKSVDITTGAGKFTLQRLSADRVTFLLGAGEVEIDQLIAKEQATIEGGAGKITIKNSSFKGLDFDMGVGELNLTAYLYGNSALNCGVGETNVTLLGNQDLYSVRVEKGLGQAKIAGQTVENNTVFGTGENRLEVSGGIGAVYINFKE